MRLMLGVFMIAGASLSMSGCASVTAVPAPPGQQARGIPLYEIKPILIVHQTGADIKYIPNYSRQYGLRLHAFLAKNKTKITLHDGFVQEIDADLDSTASIELFKTLITAAERQIGQALSEGIKSGAPQHFGVYDFVFDDAGDLIALRPLIVDGSGLLTVPPASTQGFATMQGSTRSEGPPDDGGGAVIPGD